MRKMSFGTKICVVGDMPNGVACGTNRRLGAYIGREALVARDGQCMSAMMSLTLLGWLHQTGTKYQIYGVTAPVYQE